MNFNFQYLFDAYPPIIKNTTFFIILASSILLIVVALFVKENLIKKQEFRKKIDRYQKTLILKISDIALTFSIINIFLILFRKFRIPYFQMRFVSLLWLIIILAWLITVIQHYLVNTPKQRLEDENRRKYEKYIN